MLQNETSSPDSGHPSSRNFSVTSGLSDGSLSTEDSAHVQAPQSPGKPLQDADDSQVKGKEEKAQGCFKMDHDKEEDRQDKTEENLESETRAENMNESVDTNEVKIGTKVSADDTVAAPEVAIESKGEAQNEMLNCDESEQSEISTSQGGFLTEEEETIVKDAQVEKGLVFSADTQMPRSGGHYSVSQNNEAQTTTESDESPSAIEMEEIPKAKVSMVHWSGKGHYEALSSAEEVVPHMVVRQEEGKLSPEGTDSILSDEPEMESICPRFDDGLENVKKEVNSKDSSGGPFSVWTLSLNQSIISDIKIIHFITHFDQFYACFSARAFGPVYIKSTSH